MKFAWLISNTVFIAFTSVNVANGWDIQNVHDKCVETLKSKYQEGTSDFNERLGRCVTYYAHTATGAHESKKSVQAGAEKWKRENAK